MQKLFVIYEVASVLFTIATEEGVIELANNFVDEDETEDFETAVKILGDNQLKVKAFEVAEHSIKMIDSYANFFAEDTTK